MEHPYAVSVCSFGCGSYLICGHRTCIHKISANNLLTLSTASSPIAITTIVQSPAIDVVGIGFVTGEISIYDIRLDERLMRIFVREGGVRALSFRNGALMTSTSDDMVELTPI